MNHADHIAQHFEWPMVVASLLVIPALALEESAPGPPWAAVAAGLNWTIWLAFAAELVTMLAVVPDRRTAWLRKHPIEVAVVFLTPPFAPAALQSMRAFRLLRLLRLVRLFDLRRLLSLEGIRYVALLAVLLVVVGGAAFATVEGNGLSSWDGIWWAITTVTTVGYGEITPETDTGRAIAISIMLVGIGFVALLTAFIADRFIRSEAADEERDDQLLAEVKRLHGRLDRIERGIEE